MKVLTIRDYEIKRDNLIYTIKLSEAAMRINNERVESCTAGLSFCAGLNPSKNIHPIEDSVVKKMDAEKKIENAKRELEQLNNQFEESLSLLRDPQMRVVVHLRCVDGADWNEIARATQYSRRQVQRHYEEAVLKLHIQSCKSANKSENI